MSVIPQGMFIPYDILVKKNLDDWSGKRKNPRKIYRTQILGIASVYS
jgi:hypothetical protein